MALSRPTTIVGFQHNDRRGPHIDLLFTAELQFRLASAVRLAVTMDNQPLDLPVEWSHGKHNVNYKEVTLRKDQADFAAWNMHRSATFLMAVAMKDAIKAAVPDQGTQRIRMFRRRMKYRD